MVIEFDSLLNFDYSNNIHQIKVTGEFIRGNKVDSITRKITHSTMSRSALDRVQLVLRIQNDRHIARYHRL